MSSQGDPGEGLKASARALGEAARRSTRGHPPPELLLAYHERRLPETETAQVRAHLVMCRECADLVLDLAAFPEVPLRVPLEGELEDLAPDWEEILEAHREQEAGLARGLSAGPGLRGVAALAAGLFAVTVVLAWRLTVVTQQLAEERAPEVNVPAAILLLGPTRSAEPQAVEAPASVHKVAFAVPAPAGASGPFALEIFALETGRGHRVAKVPGLIPNDASLLTFRVHRRSLPAGAYRLVVHPQGSGEILAEHRFQLSYDAGAAPGPPP